MTKEKRKDKWDKNANIRAKALMLVVMLFVNCIATSGRSDEFIRSSQQEATLTVEIKSNNKTIIPKLKETAVNIGDTDSKTYVVKKKSDAKLVNSIKVPAGTKLTGQNIIVTLADGQKLIEVIPSFGRKTIMTQGGKEYRYILTIYEDVFSVEGRIY